MGDKQGENRILEFERSEQVVPSRINNGTLLRDNSLNENFEVTLVAYLMRGFGLGRADLIVPVMVGL